MLYQMNFWTGLILLLYLTSGSVYAASPDLDSAEVVYKFQLKLAARGQAAAQYKLGMLYETGRGIPQNVEFAREWYRRAAAQDYKPAINRLVYLDIAQNGLQDKHHTWLDELKQAARDGDGEAQFLLGQMQARGIAAEQNLESAMVLLRKASGNNIPGAEEELLRVEKIVTQRKLDEEQQRLEAEKQKQLAEEQARQERQARARAIEEQKKREARQKQLAREQALKQQAEQQRLKLEAERKAREAAAQAVTNKAVDTESEDICSGRNRFLPTCR